MKKNLLFLALFTLFSFFLGCESKTSYNIDSDKAVEDLSTRITSLTEDLNTLTKELEEVKKVLEDKDIDSELRASIRKEILEGERYERTINQWLAYLKVQRKQRYNSLLARKGQKNLKEQAEQEVKAYFMQKKLKPIDRPWKERYRTAIEL